MAGFFNDMGEDLAPIVKMAMKELQDFFGANGHDALLRRFKANYDTLSLEDIGAIHAAMGHEDSEERPCKICKIMAAEEVRLGLEG